MLPDLKTWTCGRCERTILVPTEQGTEARADALTRIGEHRLGHLTDALMHGSAEDLWGLCGDDEPAQGTGLSLDNLKAAEEALRSHNYTDQSFNVCLSRLGNLGNCAPGPLVDSDDVAPVLEGIEGLLRADLPRARQLWYPINEDGGFNR